MESPRRNPFAEPPRLVMQMMRALVGRADGVQQVQEGEPDYGRHTAWGRFLGRTYSKVFADIGEYPLDPGRLLLLSGSVTRGETRSVEIADATLTSMAFGIVIRCHSSATVNLGTAHLVEIVRGDEMLAVGRIPHVEEPLLRDYVESVMGVRQADPRWFPTPTWWIVVLASDEKAMLQLKVLADLG